MARLAATIERRAREREEGEYTDALGREYPYYDPIYTLPEEGQEYWREYMRKDRRQHQPV
jgi:hypothetical protein